MVYQSLDTYATQFRESRHHLGDYTVSVHAATVSQSEIRFTLETTVDMVNNLTADTTNLRQILSEAGFSRAAEASEAAVRRVEERMRVLAPLIHDLPDLTAEELTPRINEALATLTIMPSLIDHDGVGTHMHWTPTTASFDDQIMTDVLIAVAQELCDNGSIRFGQCAASDCTDLFYDGTRNRSKRFCADPRCATRTHTADHRARQKGNAQD